MGKYRRRVSPLRGRLIKADLMAPAGDAATYSRFEGEHGESLLVMVQGMAALLAHQVVWGAVLVAAFLNGSMPDVALAAPQYHALLVGVTEYPHLPQEYWLHGPANDVALVQDVLTRRFHFTSERITVLAGWPGEEALRPTRANIARAFRRLADIAGPDDQVVIFLAGHGSQQPADDDPDDLEPDGLDEIFLPADAGRWTKTVGHVENAIVDDEIRAWVSAIRAKGAFVWVIVDTCHAGTMTRGAPREQERERYIPASVLVPEADLAAAAQRAAQRGRTRGSSGMPASVLGLPSTAGGLVATYATQAHEVEPEKPLPGKGSPWYGLFTYTLAEVLLQSSSPLTYRELVERVHARYRSTGRSGPTPLIEGSSLDREVLGLRAWPERPKILLGPPGDTRGTWLLDAGSLHGLRPGTVLAVYPPAGTADADRQVGHVRVVQIEPLKAVVEPVAFGDLPAPAAGTLVPRSRCQVVFVDYGDLRLKVAMQTQADPSAEVQTLAPGQGPPGLEAAFTALMAQPGQLVERVADPADAAWYVRVVADEVYLVPASGWHRPADQGADASPSQAIAPPQFALGPVAAGNKVQAALQEALTRIARAQHLLSLTTEVESSASAAGRVDVRLDMLRFPAQDAPQGAVVPYDQGGRVLRPGEIVAFRVTNPAPAEVDVTLLFISSTYGIKTLFPPTAEHTNRLGPGQSIDTLRFRVQPPAGTDHVVAIAVRTQTSTSSLDFSYLEQPDLPQARRDSRGAPARNSPLGRLLERAMYGVGPTRGISSTDLHGYAVRLLSWHTVVPQ